MTSMWYQLMYERFDAAFPGETEPIRQEKARELMEWLSQTLPHAIRFEVSNVAEYFYEGTPDDKKWTWPGDVPNAAPVYDVMWFEHVIPPAWRVDHDRLGVLVVAKEAADNAPLVSDVAAAVERLGRPIIESDVRWILGMYPFAGLGQRIVGPLSWLFVAVGADGAPLCSPFSPVQGVWGVYVAGLALSFMHCKNVHVIDAEPEVSRQVRRLRSRAGLPPEPKHKTLVIDPMKEVLRREGGSERVGLQRALHICRGHFSHYSDERPLFGKYAGTFWVPAHVRGSTEAGAITKDYRVLPGDAA